MSKKNEKGGEGSEWSNWESPVVMERDSPKISKKSLLYHTRTITVRSISIITIPYTIPAIRKIILLTSVVNLPWESPDMILAQTGHQRCKLLYLFAEACVCSG